MLFMLYTPLSSIFVSLFLKNSFPPSLGSMILKTALRQNHARKSFPGPPIARITPILGLLMAPGICKIDGNMCISRLWTLFGSFVCHSVFYRMHFAWHFHILAMLSSSFCWKMDPALGIHIAHIWKANTTCEICRIYMSPWCRLAGIAGFELHALFRHPETALPIRNRRAAVLPSPEGLQ